MASRQDSSSGPDWKDIAAALKSIEQTWDARCTVVVRVVGTGKFVKLQLEAWALKDPEVPSEAPPSGSASAILSLGGAGALEQAMFRLVHDLDADILRTDEGLQGLG